MRTEAIKKIMTIGIALAVLAPLAPAAAQTIKGPGGKICDRTNSCACKPNLRACVACNNTFGVEEQTRWCKINNPAYGN